MNSSTSWPDSSRKYSAIVRPVRPTRRRTPGGSFIWPKTSTVLSSTPDSSISTQRSLPSRERSPTPVNTEMPECSAAMLRISSLIVHRLAGAGAAEEADLTTTRQRRDQVDDLDAGLEDLHLRLLLVEGRRLAVDRSRVLARDVAALVERFAEHVEEAAERRRADRAP